MFPRRVFIHCSRDAIRCNIPSTLTSSIFEPSTSHMEIIQYVDTFHIWRNICVYHDNFILSDNINKYIACNASMTDIRMHKYISTAELYRLHVEEMEDIYLRHCLLIILVCMGLFLSNK
jgi:hypothetical protein